MDEQDRQDGNYLVPGKDLSSTRRVAQNSTTIVDRKETCTPSCLSCSSMLVPLPKARSVISKNCRDARAFGVRLRSETDSPLFLLSVTS